MRAHASGRASFARERVGAVRFAEFDARRLSSIVLVVAVATGCATLWNAIGSGTPAAEHATLGAPPDEWTPAALPPLIEIPRLNSVTSAPRFGAAIHATTGARRDAYALGEIGADESAAWVEAWIGSTPERERDSLFVVLAEEAARFDVAISRFARVEEMRTSRGDVEYARMVLRGASASRSCVGFRLARSAAVGLRGILCPAESDKAAETRVACLVEGVALTPDGREGGLQTVLAGAPTRRSNGAC